MPDVEQQIRAWADAAAPDTGEAVSAADVIAGRVPVATAGVGASGPGRRGRWLAAAAVVVVLAAIGTALAVRSGDDGQQVRTTEPAAVTTSAPATSVPVDPTEVPFEVLGIGQVPAGQIGQLQVAQTPEEMAALWLDAGQRRQVPTVPFAEQVVVSMTIADDACPPELSAFVRIADMVQPRFVEPQAACEQPLIARTYVAALDWEATGDEFLLVLPGTRTEDDQESLLVTRAGLDQGEDDQETREPAAGVSASLELDGTEVVAGGTLTGTVTVVNESGGPIEGTTCGGYFVGFLRNDEYVQGIARPACASDFTIPEGTSTYPIEVVAIINGCTPIEIEDAGAGPRCNADGSMPAIAPGDYEVAIDDPQHLVPAIDPLPVTVRPA